MKKKLFILLLFILFVNIRIFSTDIKHSIGIEISFYGYTSFPHDPYSLPSGLGVFYEINNISKSSFYLGADLLWYGFVAGLDIYSGSMMLIPSVSLGYNFILDLSNESKLSFSPYISYGQYVRSIEFADLLKWFSRPVITGGLDIKISTEIKTTSSLGFFVSVIMDNSPVIMPGIRVKTGYFGWGPK